jgi:hypothetical protein
LVGPPGFEPGISCTPSDGDSRMPVSFVDQRGIRHSVAVYAGSVLEAAAGLKHIRETEMIGDDGVEDLTVDIKTTTSHRVPLSKLKAWLQSSGRDPREAALKSKLR